MSLVTGPWKCDTCGQPIQNAEDGWVEWLWELDPKDSTRNYHGMRLVHHYPASPKGGEHGCQYQELSVSDASLDEFIGPDGLMNLLELLSQNKLPQQEVIEMIKRLHIPFYEETRQHIDSAIANGVFEPNADPGFYSQMQLAAVLQWMKKQ